MDFDDYIRRVTACVLAGDPECVHGWVRGSSYAYRRSDRVVVLTEHLTFVKLELRSVKGNQLPELHVRSEGTIEFIGRIATEWLDPDN